MGRKSGKSRGLEALSGLDPRELGPVPGHTVVRPPRGAVAPHKAGTKHGWHSTEVVEIPTTLQCNTCVLYALKRKDRRHPLACEEGRKNQVCVILLRLQQQWAEGLLREIQEATGTDATASDCARIEQIIRHRSRVFACENYLRVAGLIDVKSGEVRNVADRVVASENALSRCLTEFRQAVADRRDNQHTPGPRLDEYLKTMREGTAEVIEDEAPSTSATGEGGDP